MLDKDQILLILRILLGITLFLHGAQKVFGWFGGSGLKGWTEYVSSLNIPLTKQKFPSWIGPVSALVEMLTGITIALGVFTKISSVLAAVFLIFAIVLVHLNKGFFNQNGGYEYALNLLVLSGILFLSGGGKYTLTKRY